MENTLTKRASVEIRMSRHFNGNQQTMIVIWLLSHMYFQHSAITIKTDVWPERTYCKILSHYILPRACLNISVQVILRILAAWFSFHLHMDKNGITRLSKCNGSNFSGTKDYLYPANALLSQFNPFSLTKAPSTQLASEQYLLAYPHSVDFKYDTV